MLASSDKTKRNRTNPFSIPVLEHAFIFLVNISIDFLDNIIQS